MALDRLGYDPQNHQVTYQPKNHGRSVGPDSPTATTGSALDFLAALCTHIPDAGHQLVRYYGQWSHVRRARARQSCSPPAPSTPSPDTEDDCACRRRRSWARLVKKVYEADPLICPRCGRALKIIGLIDTPDVIKRILRHLKLWDRPERPPPRAPPRTLHFDLDTPAWDDAIPPLDRTGLGSRPAVPEQRMIRPAPPGERCALLRRRTGAEQRALT